MARNERTAPVPDTPSHRKELVAELRLLAAELDVVNKLQAYGATLESVERPGGHAHFFLLQLEREPRRLTITGFQRSSLQEAEQRYAAAERGNVGVSGADAVLVSVESLAALRRAYPNYYLDTSVFIKAVQRAIGYQTVRNAAPSGDMERTQ